MNRISAAFLCSLIVSLSAGCSQNQSVVRGQNPGWQGEMPMMMANGQGMPGPEPGPMYYDGPAYGHGDCPVCPPAKPADHWRPTHHHTWEYEAPKGLVYPPQNQPPAVYQYPYYTVKGPSDFFWQGP